MLPHLDPNFVLWCTLIADAFTVVASIAAIPAAIIVLRRLRTHVVDEVKKL